MLRTLAVHLERALPHTEVHVPAERIVVRAGPVELVFVAHPLEAVVENPEFLLGIGVGRSYDPVLTTLADLLEPRLAECAVKRLLHQPVPADLRLTEAPPRCHDTVANASRCDDAILAAVWLPPDLAVRPRFIETPRRVKALAPSFLNLREGPHADRSQRASLPVHVLPCQPVRASAPRQAARSDARAPAPQRHGCWVGPAGSRP